MHRKHHTGKIWGTTYKGTDVAFWDFGLKATSNAFMTNRQIESARKVLVRYIRKIGKMWIRVFPDVPMTKKPLEQKMGKWKWDVDRWVCRIHKWRVLFEVSGVDRTMAEEMFKQASYKLPVTTRFVAKDEIK